MILPVWAALAALAIIMVIVGLTRPSESAQAMVGFFFLFLLSFHLMAGTLEYRTGDTVQTNYSYAAGNLTQTQQSTVYDYDPYQSKSFGLYLAFASAAGLVGTFMSWRRGRKEADGF